MPHILDPGHWDDKLERKPDPRPQEQHSWVGREITCAIASCRCRFVLVETDYVWAPIWPGRTDVRCSVYCPRCRLVNEFTVPISDALRINASEII